MRFLFINPRRDIEKRNVWSIVNSISPPIGLAILSAVLEKQGYDSDIIDAAALDLGIDEIIARIDPGTDIIGLTATTPEIDGAIDTAKAIRHSFPEIKIVMGGVHPTLFHKELMEGGICDMVVRGEGENAIIAIAMQQPIETIPNLTWRSERGEIMVNPHSSTFVDLNTLPFPAYHKLPMSRYRSALGAAKRSPSIGMITSRGCPGKCTFCYSGMFGSKIRFMSAERVFEQILHLKSCYGIREISFYDDTFTANRRRIEDLCNLMISEKADISWSCFARVDSVNPELLKLMKGAGCHQICYGFESADENILRAINKLVDTNSISNAIMWTSEAGIDMRGAFMLGNPEETEETIQKTIDFSKKIGIQFAMFNITTPFPGTALFDWAVEKGFIRHMDWKLYDLSHAVMEIPGIPSDVVQRYYYRAYREFYFRLSYVLNRLFSIRTKDDVKNYLKAFRGILSMIGRGAVPHAP
jgi:radical SAM superfamily enzyme YgiQ (UPF0313 family)